MSESLDALAAAGLPVDAIDEDQRAVLAALTPDETRVLVGIIEKMTGEVEGFGFSIGSLQTPSLRPTIQPGAMPGEGPGMPAGLGPDALADKGNMFW
jgi:hypothetical protein